jgi:hypothetical protein
MTGYSTGRGGGRYFIGGSAGQTLVSTGLLVDALSEGMAAYLEEGQRGEALLARRNAGEALDEVDTEILDAYLVKKAKLEEQAQAAFVRRQEARRRDLEAKAYRAAVAKRDAAYGEVYRAAAEKRDAAYTQARTKYDKALRATGKPQAETKRWVVQFIAFLSGIGAGMIGAGLYGL